MRKTHEINFDQWLACVSVCQNKIWSQTDEVWLKPDSLRENLEWWKETFEAGATPEEAVVAKIESILSDE